jgi:hypothetical protein
VTSHIQDRWAGRHARPGPPSPATATDTEPVDAEPISTGPVNGFEILAKLTVLPVSSWRFRWEPAGVRHLGPMAQDWHGIFELGQAEITIPLGDAHRVLLVAIPAVHRQLDELCAELDQLHQQLADHPSPR